MSERMNAMTAMLYGRPVRRQGKVTRRVSTRAWSADGAVEVGFDAAPLLSCYDAAELEKLYEHGWRGIPEATRLIFALDDRGDARADNLLKHCAEKQVGFSVLIDSHEADRWFGVRRCAF